jgi:hypothetical protein
VKGTPKLLVRDVGMQDSELNSPSEAGHADTNRGSGRCSGQDFHQVNHELNASASSQQTAAVQDAHPSSQQAHDRTVLPKLDLSNVSIPKSDLTAKRSGRLVPGVSHVLAQFSPAKGDLGSPSGLVLNKIPTSSAHETNTSGPIFASPLRTGIDSMPQHPHVKTQPLSARGPLRDSDTATSPPRNKGWHTERVTGHARTPGVARITLDALLPGQFAKSKATIATLGTDTQNTGTGHVVNIRDSNLTNSPLGKRNVAKDVLTRTRPHVKILKFENYAGQPHHHNVASDAVHVQKSMKASAPHTQDTTFGMPTTEDMSHASSPLVSRRAETNGSTSTRGNVRLIVVEDAGSAYPNPERTETENVPKESLTTVEYGGLGEKDVICSPEGGSVRTWDGSSPNYTFIVVNESRHMTGESASQRIQGVGTGDVTSPAGVQNETCRTIQGVDSGNVAMHESPQKSKHADDSGNGNTDQDSAHESASNAANRNHDLHADARDGINVYRHSHAHNDQDDPGAYGFDIDPGTGNLRPEDMHASLSQHDSHFYDHIYVRSKGDLEKTVIRMPKKGFTLHIGGLNQNDQDITTNIVKSKSFRAR